MKFSSPNTPHGIFQILAIVYALLLYPILGTFEGHGYPAGPIFGLPCPTTIFTFAVLSASQINRRALIKVSLIPVVWALIGTVGALQFGIYEDYLLVISAIAFLGLSFFRSPFTNIRKPIEMSTLRKETV